jgi:cold shock CspA family protein
MAWSSFALPTATKPRRSAVHRLTTSLEFWRENSARAKRALEDFQRKHLNRINRGIMSTDNIKDRGLVVRWNRRFGFIRPDGGGQVSDVYFNLRHVKENEPLAYGTRVEYHLAPDWRDASKVMAVDVEIVR